MTRYLEDDVQQIFRIVLDFRLHTFLPTLALALHYKGLYEKLLKAQFLDIYCGKTYLECYNFFQQY